MRSKGSSRRVKPKDHGHRLAGIHAQGVDWKRRAVYIVGELSDEKAYQYIPALHLMDETPGAIKVFVLSPGGEEPGGWALFDTIRHLKNSTTTIGLGGVYSIAALIFQAGKTRILTPHAQLMMHNGHMAMEAGDLNSDFVKQLAQEAIQNDGRYHRAIAARSNADLRKVEDWCRDERYFLAQEAVEEGLADRLVRGWKDLI